MEAQERLVKILKDSGAAAVGFAPAEPVDSEEWRRFENWLERGWHAGMEYMKRYPDIRRDPRLLLEGAKSIVSIAFNYRQPNPFPQVATYALGEDYHKVLRRLLKSVVKAVKGEFGGDWRICIDSAPVLERYWAVRAGVGWRSPLHGNIVVPGTGSMVFLAEIITTLEFTPSRPYPEIEVPSEKTVCPTGALQPGGMVDARRCINYLTIEHPGPLDAMKRSLVGNAFFGCDICQRSCRENLTPYPPLLDEFRPLEGLEEFINGNSADFDISRSPIKRAVKSGIIKI